MTDYHVFNIGQPPTSEWWGQNLKRGVITAGFDGEEGDRGDVVLNDMAEGDMVLAYANGHGFVGVGYVLAPDTYRLHAQVPRGSFSDHQHERGVRWIHFVTDVADAVSLEETDRQAPRQTKEREGNEEIALRILRLLSERSPTSLSKTDPLPTTGAKYWHVADAVRATGHAVSIKQIQVWLAIHHSEENHKDAIDNACLLTVNDANRRHHDRPRKNFRSDQGHSRDLLFRRGKFSNVTYEVYDLARHGVWDLQRNSNGKIVAMEVPLGPIALAIAEAHQQVASEAVLPVDSYHDGRVFELRAVAMREGQGEFRIGLLEAYDRRCAMTGCSVVEILEAAHIKPYRGPETHRTDNGLLLRADIHTLFDKGLLWVDEYWMIQISDRLRGSEYEPLHGRRLRVPAKPEHHPHSEHLAYQRKMALEEQERSGITVNAAEART